jgi:hypothetical protein
MKSIVRVTASYLNASHGTQPKGEIIYGQF